MIMKRFHIALFCILACACTAVIPEPEPQELEMMSFTAMPEEHLETTKTSLDSSYGICWGQTDAISMFRTTGGHGVNFSVSSIEQNGAVASFTGPSGDYALALYPASGDASYAPATGTVTASIPTVQTGVEDSFADGANLSLAVVGTDDKLYFRNVGALLSFTVPGNWITRIRIQSRNESVAMSGPASITLQGGIPVVTPNSKTCNYIEVTVPEQSAGKRCFAVVYPGNYSDGFKVTFLTSSGAYNRYTSTKALSLARKTIVSLIRRNWTVNDDRAQTESGIELIAPEISAGGPVDNASAKIVFSCGSGARDTYKFYLRDAGSMGSGTLVGTLNTGSAQYGTYNYTFTGLTGGASYDLGVSASASGYTDSPTVWMQDVTITSGGEDPYNGGMYSWESARSGVPSFADISLVTLGQHNPNPPAWTKARFASHVTYTDGNSQPHWLYDAFLCCDTYDASRNRYYCITSIGKSATKASWQDLLDAWLGDNGALRKLDAAIDDATSVLGTPPRPRYVVMALPDPIMFETFSNKNSSTTYWGQIDDVTLDFSKLADQEAAYKWYMDRCRERFNALGFSHLELAGFYILSEELHLPGSYYSSLGESYAYSETYNYQYKRWHQLVPYVAQYAHSLHEGLWWIPYYLAPGYTVWSYLGFDRAFMQPNHYWDHSGASQHSMTTAIDKMKQYNMGIELEFEYSMVASVMADGRPGPDMDGNDTFYASDVPALRSNFRDYLSAYGSSGLYGVLPVAVYSGTDAMHQLATSTDAGDRGMYHELCQFIINSPLKQ